MKKRIVVICPGRGSYTKETLGYLRQFGGHVSEFLLDLDQRRTAIGEPTVSALDGAEAFKPALHTRGEHASPLIYACAYADFMAIDRERYDIVAVTGNSMGWYLTLAFGGSLDWQGGFEVVNTMGSMMKQEVIGGQVIYPVCDSEWRPQPLQADTVRRLIDEIHGRGGCELYPSIALGGYAVIGGNKAGLAELMKRLPKIEDYPFQLINHAAFHTPLLRSTSERAFQMLPKTLFQAPKIPLIDGRGIVWQPYSTDLGRLYDYTLDDQVVKPYDFTQAVTVALREFAPDHLVLLGPGGSLGGALGQIMIQNNWLGLTDKHSFQELQSRRTFLISMGRAEQRSLVC